MQSDFVPKKLKKAKWLLTKNLDISKERQEEIYPKIPKKRSWWYRLKLRIFGL
ncbi:MAG: hypothetical protein U9R27_10815 [Campylobacterota bacterium]|nr:hypothetical protein [Campylobacterota bacterium]